MDDVLVADTEVFSDEDDEPEPEEPEEGSKPQEDTDGLPAFFNLEEEEDHQQRETEEDAAENTGPSQVVNRDDQLVNTRGLRPRVIKQKNPDYVYY